MLTQGVPEFPVPEVPLVNEAPAGKIFEDRYMEQE